MEPANDDWKEVFGRRLADYEPDDVNDDRFLSVLETSHNTPELLRFHGRLSRWVKVSLLVVTVLWPGFIDTNNPTLQRSHPAEPLCTRQVGRTSAAEAVPMPHRSDPGSPSAAKPTALPALPAPSLTGSVADQPVRAYASDPRRPRSYAQPQAVPSVAAGRVARTRSRAPAAPAGGSANYSNPNEPGCVQPGQSGLRLAAAHAADSVTQLIGLRPAGLNAAMTLSALKPAGLRLPDWPLPTLHPLPGVHNGQRKPQSGERWQVYLRFSPVLNAYRFQPDQTDRRVIEDVRLYNQTGRSDWRLETGLLLALRHQQYLRLGLAYQFSRTAILLRQQTGSFVLPDINQPQTLQRETAVDTVRQNNQQVALSAEWLLPIATGQRNRVYGLVGTSAGFASASLGQLQVVGCVGLGLNRSLTSDGRLALQVELAYHEPFLSAQPAHLAGLTIRRQQAGLRFGLAWALR